MAVLAALVAGCASQRFDRADVTGATTGGTAGAAYDQPMPPALIGTDPIAGGQPTQLPPTTTAPGTVATGTLPPAAGTTAAPTTVAATTPAPAAEATVHLVVAGDTLYSLARAYGVSVAAIAGANGLTQTSTLTIGQRLVIPLPGTTAALGTPPAPLGVMTNTGTTPTTPAPTTPAPVAAGGAYVVQTGDTLYSIAMRHGVSVNALAAANGLTNTDVVRVGQQLTIPGGGTTVAATTPPPATTTPPPAATPPPNTTAAVDPTTTTDAPPATTVTVEPPAAPAVPAAQPSTTGTDFRWPAQGRVISDFGVRANGERNDGINLAVPTGTEIHAAEAGTVIYSGNGIAGYGNLILIEHADNWVTAYAHLSEMRVERGATVTRGQVVGLAGATGAVTTAQLHFELRRGTVPVNPLDYLRD